MTMTTRVQSVSIPVADQDRALAFYTGVLGCDCALTLRCGRAPGWWKWCPPARAWAWSRYPQTRDPLAVRLGTTDAESSHAQLRAAGATLHTDEVMHLDGAPPLFAFADLDGNGLVYMEEPRGGNDS